MTERLDGTPKVTKNEYSNGFQNGNQGEALNGARGYTEPRRIVERDRRRLGILGELSPKVDLYLQYAAAASKAEDQQAPRVFVQSLKEAQLEVFMGLEAEEVQELIEYVVGRRSKVNSGKRVPKTTLSGHSSKSGANGTGPKPNGKPLMFE